MPLSARRLPASAAFLAAVLALAACESQSPQDAVRETATQYSSALANGDAKKACERTSDDAKRELAAAGDCPAVIKMVITALSDAKRRGLRDFSVAKVVIKGDRATAEGTDATRLGLVKDGGRWLITADPDQLNRRSS
jgi:hypothetical protein